MTCRVLLFAGLADAASCREFTLELSDGATVNDAISLIAHLYPAIASLLKSVSVAIDEQYVSRDSIVPNGCTVALIPPVSGG